MLPDIPITELFSYQEFPMERVALRWYSSKTTMEMLGIKERQLRRYAEDGRNAHPPPAVHHGGTADAVAAHPIAVQHRG